jgi:hypothetical protein
MPLLTSASFSGAERKNNFLKSLKPLNKMKKTLISTIALTVFAIAIIQSCNSSSSKLDRFMGEWKRIDKPDKHHYFIKEENDAIVGIEDKDTCAGVFDANRNVLKFYVLGQAGVVTYIEKTDHLLLNKGGDGEYERVK